MAQRRLVRALATDEQARGAAEAVVPSIELPRTFPNYGPANARNIVALNVGSDSYQVGAPVKAEKLNPVAVADHAESRRSVAVRSHRRRGGGCQWPNLRQVLNSLMRHGYAIPAGSVILGGALGMIQPGEKGRYEASFGDLRTISFKLK